MKDDRRQTAWGLDYPASRDGARLLIKAIRAIVDRQNRFQYAGMKDEQGEAFAAAPQWISEAFEDLAARFIEPHTATNQAMVKLGYVQLYRLVANSFFAGYRSMEASDKKLEFLEEKRQHFQRSEYAS
jgi:hypothetical protein